jgi:hypothetical protein
VVEDAADADRVGRQTIDQEKGRARNGHFPGTGHPTDSAHVGMPLEQLRLPFNAIENPVGGGFVIRGDEQPCLEFVLIRPG